MYSRLQHILVNLCGIYDLILCITISLNFIYSSIIRRGEIIFIKEITSCLIEPQSVLPYM